MKLNRDQAIQLCFEMLWHGAEHWPNAKLADKVRGLVPLAEMGMEPFTPIMIVILDEVRDAVAREEEIEIVGDDSDAVEFQETVKIGIDYKIFTPTVTKSPGKGTPRLRSDGPCRKIDPANKEYGYRKGSYNYKFCAAITEEFMTIEQICNIVGMPCTGNPKRCVMKLRRYGWAEVEQFTNRVRLIKPKPKPK